MIEWNDGLVPTSKWFEDGEKGWILHQSLDGFV